MNNWMFLKNAGSKKGRKGALLLTNPEQRKPMQMAFKMQAK